MVFAMCGRRSPACVPTEIEGREAVRQGEWFFVFEPGVNDKNAVVLRNEPLTRGGGSKPHFCEELMRRGGEVVMVSREYPAGAGPFALASPERLRVRRSLRLR